MSIEKKVIANVVCGSPPADVHTDVQCLEWRERDLARMKDELVEQILAWAELQNGATRH